MLIAVLSLPAAEKYRQSNLKNPFNEFVDVIHQRLLLQKENSVAPRPDELKDWDRALLFIRNDSIDQAAMLLSGYNYSVTTINDFEDGATYLAVSENEPATRNWGTFVFNRHARKRLYVHVERPSKEGNTVVVGSELFRRLGAEWLCIAGTQDMTSERTASGQVRTRASVFSRWHEILVDLTHVTLSVHGFRSAPSMPEGGPTEIVVSNGRTSDEQWGISQISLGVRDSLRQAGFACALAMFDSGYAPLAGGRNKAGVFSNDSVGFGHWIGFEMAAGVRFNPASVRRFVGAIDRALDMTGKRISQQVNRAFGLVSPRVVRVDSLHRIMFPPSGGESYRIVSFNAASDRADTLDVRMGRWLDMGDGGRAVTSVTPLDSGMPAVSAAPRSSHRGTRTAVVQASEAALPTFVKLPALAAGDSGRGGRRAALSQESIRFNRIPLDKVPVREYAPQFAHGPAPFSLPGIFPVSDRTPIPVFGMTGTAQDAGESALSFLVPLINPTSASAGADYVGVRMNNVLVNEIARLVAAHTGAGRDIGLVAEVGPDGSYYLRVVTSEDAVDLSSADLARRF